MSRTLRNNHGMRRLLLLVLIVTATAGNPASALAQTEPTEITVAFFAPSVFFDDSIARAGFISTLAAQIESEVGVTVRGINTSSARDLGSADFAIVDGQYFAGAEPGAPLLSTRTDGETAAALALIVASDGPNRVSDLQGGTLILPRVGDQLEAFVGAEILRGEIDAVDFFADIQFTSNVESALSAVSSGRADATVAFSDYGSRGGLSVIDRFSEAPLPVVVQLNDALPTELVESVRSAFRGATGNGEIGGFSSYDRDAVSHFQRTANRARPERSPQMTPARTITMPLGDVELPDVDEDLPLPNPVGLLAVPPMEEL